MATKHSEKAEGAEEVMGVISSAYQLYCWTSILFCSAVQNTSLWTDCGRNLTSFWCTSVHKMDENVLLPVNLGSEIKAVM
jgi:hypothetical protein